MILIAQRFKGEFVQFRSVHSLSLKPAAVAHMFINDLNVPTEAVQPDNCMIVEDENFDRAKL